MIFHGRRQSNKTTMPSNPSCPLVHLELHTPNLACACAIYRQLFRWRVENLRVGASAYVAFDTGEGLTGGVTECERELPVLAFLRRGRQRRRRCPARAGSRRSRDARAREGPAGWRSTVMSPARGPVALWQRKRGYESFRRS